MKVMYLDESGNHDLRRIDANYPVFVLGGVVADRSYVREVIQDEVRQFKMRQFGRDDIVLHTVDMHKGRGSYGFLADPRRRTTFYAELNQMIDALDFTVVACVIRKAEHVARHGERAGDPYHISLKYLIERFCLDLGVAEDSGYICAEKRNPGQDAELLEEWERLLRTGTEHVRAREIDAKILGIDLRDKQPSLAAMQLADLVITPIGRHIAGKPPSPNAVQWNVVERKLRRVQGEYLGPGLIIRPR